MPNEQAIRQNSIGGLIEDNPLAAAATTLTSAGLQAAVEVTSASFMWIVLDPDGEDGSPEHVKLTLHTAGGSTGTILRAQNGTTAREHAAGIRWIHGPIAEDFRVLSGAGSPEGVIAASIGTLYTRTDGGASTTLYVKESGLGNTGWVAK